MSAIEIDTLTFSDLVKTGLEEIPGASRREWTLHGAVDPGVTLLEVLAWQFEQRLFMADQLTEPMVRASLRLLGVDEPRPAQPAVTVLSVTSGEAPAGTVFSLADGRAFATDDALTVQPVIAVETRDGLEFTLRVDGPGSGELSLLVELDAAPGVAPAWTRDAVAVEPPVRLRWEAIGPAGTRAAVDVADTTGAFRRSGLLRLPWPAVWDEPGAESPRLRAVVVDGFFTEPVRVLGVSPNAVIARHRVAAEADVSDQLDTFLPLPQQRLVLDAAAGELLDDAVLSVTERDGLRHDWTGVQSWVGIGPGDRVFVVDRERGELRFGDGRAGRILRPADGGGEGRVRFARGGGRGGDAGSYSAWVAGQGPVTATAVNPVAASGGADPESFDAARQRAADALAARDRTVTADDARRLAQTTRGLGLARAHAAAGLHPAFPCNSMPGALTLTVVPHADRNGEPATWAAAPRPDAGALATVRARLERARLLGQEIFVSEPVYRRVAVAVSVSAFAGSEATRERVVDVLRRHLDPLAGGSEGAGWPFGGPVRPSALAAVVARALGPEATVTRLAVALDGGAWADCTDVEIGPRELVWLESATVSWVTSSPTGGGMR